MQFADSSVVGTIEVDTATAIDFDLLARRSDLTAIRQREVPPHAHHSSESRGGASFGPPVMTTRVPRHALTGASRVSADLPRLERDLRSTLAQLRRELSDRHPGRTFPG